MTAVARKPAAWLDPLAVFTLRCAARATLYAAGELSLHEAIDLQAAELDQDTAQRILAEAFGGVRDDLGEADAAESAADAAPDPLIAGLKICADTKRHLDEWEKRKREPALRGWREAAIQYHEDRGGRASLIDPNDPAIDRARRLMAGNVSPNGVAESTMMAAEYLSRDPERLRQWLERRAPEERAAIEKHLTTTRRGGQ